MGRLIEQPIKALFNGVSRQPHNVRLTSQVEEANNTLLSVVTGGFEKRPATQLVLSVAGLAATGSYAFHTIDRDPTEQYVVLVDNAGVVKVYDVVNDVAKTVNSYSSAIQTYVTATDPQNDLAFVTIADYTIVVNRNKTTAMGAAPATTLNGAINTTATTITLDDSTGFPSKGGVEIGSEIITYTGLSNHQLTGCTRGTNGTSAASHADEAAIAPKVVGYKDSFGDLLAGGEAGVFGITNTASEFDDYFVEFDDDTQSWKETVDPALANAFDDTTMPHKLVREANGTWTLSTVSWSGRQVGDLVSVPNPQFVGRKMSDAFFFRNRLGFLADENVFFSQSGDFFNLWPDKAAEVLDTDSIDVAASTTKVTLLRWAVPFRKALFLSADRAQFELSTTGALTPSSAVVDLATNYSTDNLCKPVALGDELYFAGKSGGNSVIYEYFVEDDTLTNVAIDITKHAEGYVPADVTMMAGDPTTGRLFCYTNKAAASGDYDELYVYTVYFDGTTKAQSAWTKWNLNCDSIKGMGVIDGFLYILAVRDGVNSLERLPLMTEAADATLGHAIMLDGRTNLTGTYASGTGLTTWTLPYAHRQDAEGILPAAFTTDAGKKLALNYVGGATGTSVTAVGNYASSAVTFGMPYEMRVEFSKQYVRETDGSSVIRGRFQVRTMRVYFTDTGFFKAVVTPENRDAKTYTMTGRILGSASNIIGKPALLTDTWQFPVKSRGDTCKVELVNDSHLPCTINSASLVGFFNEITRQE